MLKVKALLEEKLKPKDLDIHVKRRRPANSPLETYDDDDDDAVDDKVLKKPKMVSCDDIGIGERRLKRPVFTDAGVKTDDKQNEFYKHTEKLSAAATKIRKAPVPSLPVEAMLFEKNRGLTPEKIPRKFLRKQKRGKFEKAVEDQVRRIKSLWN